MPRLAQFLPLLLLALFAPLQAAEKTATKAPDAAAKHTLRYKFHPGEVLRWEVIHRARVETTVSGTSQTADTQSTSVKAWRVKSVEPDGSATFEHSVESVDMRHKLSGRMEVRYNSQTDKKPPLGFETVAKSIGVPLSTIRLDARGKVLHREHTAAKASQEKEGQITIPLPEEAVPAGHSWSFPYDVEVPANNATVKRIKTLQSFTLEDVHDGIATIRVATQVLSPIHDPAIEAQVVQRESSGTVRFDLVAGRIVGQQMDVDKQVVGFSGPASSLHYRTHFTEKYFGEAKAETKAATDTEKKKEEVKTASRPNSPQPEPTLAPPKPLGSPASQPSTKLPPSRFVVPPEPRAMGNR